MTHIAHNAKLFVGGKEVVKRSVYDHPDWLALMAAIRANLADDVPRLIAADWLEEHGEHERAEWIRIGIQQPHYEFVWFTAHDHNRPYELLNLHGWGWASNKTDGSYLVRGNSRYFIRRGFIAEVRCTLADWVGGECQRCGGTSMRIVSGSVGACPHCSATGRTHAHGPAIARMGALERVTLTDRRPWQSEVNYRWLGSVGGVPTPEYLPRNIFEHCIADEEGWRRYPTEAAANDAVSEACIKWALAQPAEVMA